MQMVISRTAVTGRGLLVVLALIAALIVGGLGGYSVRGAAAPAHATSVVVAPSVQADPNCLAVTDLVGPSC